MNNAEQKYDLRLDLNVDNNVRIIERAMYGLNTSGAAWWAMLLQFIESLPGFEST